MVTLIAETQPNEATTPILTWSSSNPSIATVDNGRITGKGVGRVDIKVTSDNGLQASCNVIVTNIKANMEVLKSSTDTQFKFLIETLASPLAKAEVSYSVDSENYITRLFGKGYTGDLNFDAEQKTYSETINLSGLRAGNSYTFYVNVTTVAGEILVQQFTYTKIPEPTSITLNKTKLELNVEESQNLQAIVLPENANQEVRWTQSNSNIATINEVISGNKLIMNIKGIAPGTTTITVTTSNGKTDTCLVTVKQPVSTITIQPSTKALDVGETIKLLAKIDPSNATDKTVSWESSNKDIAKVSNNGTVTAVTAGKATITATASNGKKATCIITVIDLKASITVTKYPNDIRFTFMVESASSQLVTTRISYSVDNETTRTRICSKGYSGDSSFGINDQTYNPYETISHLKQGSKYTFYIEATNKAGDKLTNWKYEYINK